MSAGATGKLGEMAAANFLRDQGYAIAAANYRTRFGEIDLIAVRGAYIVFAEVKTRAEGSPVLPREAVDARKQRRIILAAQGYLAQAPCALQPRFDVIEVITAKEKEFRTVKIEHIVNAFTL